MSRQAIKEFLAIDFDQIPKEERLNSILNSVVESSAKIFSDVFEMSEDEFSKSPLDEEDEDEYEEAYEEEYEEEEEECLTDLKIQFHKRVCELLLPLRRVSAAVRRELALLMYRMAENNDPLTSIPQQILDLLKVNLLSVLNKALKARKVEGTEFINQTIFDKLAPEKKVRFEADLKRYVLTKQADRWIDISAEQGDKLAFVLQQRLLIDASLSARYTSAAEKLELVPITEEMFFAICKENLNKEGRKEEELKDFWRQYIKKNHPPFNLSFLLQKWVSNKNNSQENIEVKALLENVELPVSDINVLWVWWLQSQEEKNSDTIPYYLEYGPGCRQISIARNTSEKYFSKLDAIFRSDIVMYLEAFIGEAHYCSKPLLNFLLEDGKKTHFDQFFEGLLKTKEIAKGWACYFAPQAAELQQAILKELPCEEILISNPGVLARQEAYDVVPAPACSLRRTATGITESMSFFKRLKEGKVVSRGEEVQGSQMGHYDSQEMEIEKKEEAGISATVCGDPTEEVTFSAQSGVSSQELFGNSARGSAKRKAVEPAEQEGGQRLKKQRTELISLG